MSNRVELEKLARETISAGNFYDLVPEEMSDYDLQRVIDCDGDYYLECAVVELYEETDKNKLMARANEIRSEIDE